MQEYRFQHDPTAPRGRVVFRISNNGRVDHAMTLARLPAEITKPVGELFGGGEHHTIAVTAQLYTHGPGTTGTFAVDLLPGRYVMVCFVAGPDGQQHLRKGMLSEFRVP